MQREAALKISGSRSFRVLRKDENERPQGKGGIVEILKGCLPVTRDRDVNVYRLKNFRNIWRGLRTLLLHAILRPIGIQRPIYGTVFAKVIRGNGSIVNLGIISLRVVTDTGVGFIVDAFQNTVEVENLKFHGYGTGTNAEAAGNTALQTELTTQYATDNTRPTGSTTEGASANIYRSVATLSPDASVAITEHGMFSANSGGVLFDRSVFSAINLTNVDSLQTTYDLTVPSGG
ncbi:MAG: hypothetical protein AB7Q00_15965 [Phycisphaerales bacterium]